MQVLLSITSPRMKPFVLQVYCVQPVFSTADGWTICTSDLVIETTLSCYKSDKRCPQKDTTQLLIDFQLLLWHPCNMNGWGEPVNPWEALSFLGYLASSFPGFRSPPPHSPVLSGSMTLLLLGRCKAYVWIGTEQNCIPQNAVVLCVR